MSAAWLVSEAGALTVLWLGVYDVFGSLDLTETSMCFDVDMTLVIVGVLANFAVAGAGFLLLDRTVWPVLTALPGMVVVALLLAFPCSFLPHVTMPVVCLLAIAFAVVVTVRHVLGADSAQRRAAG